MKHIKFEDIPNKELLRQLLLLKLKKLTENNAKFEDRMQDWIYIFGFLRE